MLNFTFSIPTEIFFGKSQIDVLGEQIKKHSGSRVLICYGSNRIKESGLLGTVTTILEKHNIAFFELSGIQPNPRVSSVREGIKTCRENNIDFIFAVGGGSVIDCAKAIAAGFYYEGDPWDFFIHTAEITQALPLATMLTLAATGSEMNGNAVISNWEMKEKRAVGSPLLKPRFSILDPVYTFTVPTYHTAAGTVDIMSHVFEQYFTTTDETYLQSRLVEAILKTAFEFGPIALNEPQNYEARANLLWAGTLALNGILSFGYSGDWAVHSIEHAASAVSDITHGVGLAILTPQWMKYVLDDSNVDKFHLLAVNVFGVESDKNKTSIAEEGIEKIREFFNSLGMPKQLTEVGIAEKQLDEIAQKAVRFGAIGSLKELNYDDVYTILKMAL